MYNEGTTSYFTTNAIIILPDTDFKIETVIKKISGVHDFGFGLIWTGKNNKIEFQISGNGFFTIVKTIKGKITVINQWEENNFINKWNGSINKLTITRKNDNIIFSINDTSV